MKLITKIVGATLGLAMAVGVGVGVANYNNKAVNEVNAATIGTNLAQVTSLVSGKQYVIVGNNNGYALPTSPTLSSGKVAGTAIASVPIGASGYLWTFTQSGSYWLIGDGTHYIYHSNGGASGTNLAYGDSQASYPWKLTYSTSSQNHWTFKGVVAPSTENSRGMLCNGSNFGGYALSNESSYKYMNIYEPIKIDQTLSSSVESAYADETITISSDATTTVTWSIVEGAGTTAEGASVTSEGVVSVTGAGTVTVKAVASGYNDATKQVTFNVRPAGTYYDVTFDSDGGSISPAKLSILSGSTFAFPSPGTKEHYTFDGWTSDLINYYNPGDTSPAVTGDIEYLGFWTKDPTYAVTYSAGSNGTGSFVDDDEHFSGEYTLLPFNSLTGVSAASDYQFKDYTVGGVRKNPGDVINIDSAVTVTVNFEELNYKVVFGTADGTAGISNFNNTSFVIPAGVTLNNMQGDLYCKNDNTSAAIRLGKGSSTGSFDATINSNYFIKRVVANLKYYGSDSTAKFAVTPSEGEPIETTLTNAFTDYEFDVSASYTNKITLGSTVSGKRVYISGFTIFYGTKTTKGIIEHTLTKTSISYHYSKDGDNDPVFTNLTVRFGGQISKTLWDALDDNSNNILGYGIMLSSSASIKAAYDAARAGKASVDATFEEVDGKDYTLVSGTTIKNFYNPVSTQVRESGTDYIWYLGKRVSSDETGYTRDYTAVAYIRTTSDEIVFLTETTKSAAQAAKDLINADPDDEYDNDYLEGSLAYLAGFAA